METPQGSGRRQWLRFAVVAPVLRAFNAVAAGAAGEDVKTWSRTFEVHARISLFNMPLFSKGGVGGGVIMVEESRCGAERRTALQLCAGSSPGRLKGFNRFGLTQELVRELQPRTVESSYLSFMTTSTEKSFSEARRSYLETAEASTFSVAHGHSTPGRSEAGLERLNADRKLDWRRSAELAAEFRRRLAPMRPVEHGGGPESAAGTFLHAVRTAVLSDRAETRQPFLRLGKQYTLDARKRVNGPTVELTGQIHERNGAGRSEFRIWCDAGDPSAIPYRIEFRAKSYLHLVFESATPIAASAIHPILREGV